LPGENRLSADLEKLVEDTALVLDNPTISELVDRVVKDKGVKFKDATKAVYVMWKKGILELSETDPPSTFLSYIFHLENLWFWGLSAFVAFTVLVIFLIDATPLLYIRYIMGGIFILFLPGAVLVAALYPNSNEIDELEKVALSIGLSLAIVPLIGLMLNYAPWGIRLEPIVISLAAFAEIMAIVCVVRKFRYYQLRLK
jgi:hypothetical protein